MPIGEEKTDEYITLKEASERFGYSADYLGQLIRKGKIPGKQVYSHVAWVTTPKDIEEYIAREKKSGTKAQKISEEDVEEKNSEEKALIEDEILLQDENVAEGSISGKNEEFIDRLFGEKFVKRVYLILIVLFVALIVAILFLASIFIEELSGKSKNVATNNEVHIFQLSLRE